jgi:hypothetical protein
MKLWLPILLLILYIHADQPPQIEPKLALPPKNISEEYEGY